MISEPTGHQPSRDPFVALTLAYLLSPSLVFLLTWCRPMIGVPVAVAVLSAFYRFCRKDNLGPPRLRLTSGTWLLIIGMALGWTLLAGVGGFVWQASDYEKHNLAFHDLVTRAWPVTYATGGQTYYFCYGSGYYLVPALVARVFSAAALPGATLVWGGVGVGLFFYWLATFSHSAKRTVAIVLVFAATEAIWHIFLHVMKSPHFAPAGQTLVDNFERLGVSSDYSDCFSALQFRPQHVLAAWLGTTVLYEFFWVRRSPRGAGLAWAACVFWSPLTCLGLLLVPLAAKSRWSWRVALEPVNAAGGLLLMVLAVYFQGHVPLMEQGPIWKFAAGQNWLWGYPFFVLMELTPMVLLLLMDWKYGWLGEFRPLFRISLAVLLLVPLYKIGYYGDLRLQVQTSALLWCGLAASRCFQSPEFGLRRPLCALLVASQLVGAAYPVARWWQDAWRARTDYSFAATHTLWGYENLSEFKRFGYDYASQYLGRTDSWAVKWLLRREDQ